MSPGGKAVTSGTHCRPWESILAGPGKSVLKGLRAAPIPVVYKLSSGPHPSSQTRYLEHQHINQTDMKWRLKQRDKSAARAPGALLSTSGNPCPQQAPHHMGMLSARGARSCSRTKAHITAESPNGHGQKPAPLALTDQSAAQ